jgi:hypothetical protein
MARKLSDYSQLAWQWQRQRQRTSADTPSSLKLPSGAQRHSSTTEGSQIALQCQRFTARTKLRWNEAAVVQANRCAAPTRTSPHALRRVVIQEGGTVAAQRGICDAGAPTRARIEELFHVRDVNVGARLAELSCDKRVEILYSEFPHCQLSAPDAQHLLRTT